MIYWEFIEEIGLQYFKCWDPFDLDEILRLILKNSRSNGPGSRIDSPTFFDLKNVNLIALESHELRRFVTRRRSIDPKAVGNPFAVLVGSEGSFGMMRMYSVYAEIDGLRDMTDSFASMDFGEIVSWLAGKAGCSDPVELRAAIERADSRAVESLKNPNFQEKQA